jgi:hypothetical protein
MAAKSLTRTLALCGIWAFAYGATSSPAPAQNRPGGPAPYHLPSVMHFCALNCMTLEWRGRYYLVTSKLGPDPRSRSAWEVERFDAGAVILHRHDFPSGYSPTYRARISPEGDRLVDIVADGRPNPAIQITWGAALNTIPGSNEERDRKLAASSPPPAPAPPAAPPSAAAPIMPPKPVADLTAAAPSLPGVIHFCAANCMTLKLQNGHYVVDDPNYGSRWDVKSFTPDSVVLQRQWSRMEWDATYTGKISPDGNALVDVAVNGKTDPNVHFTWGTALEQTPGNNAERDRRNAQNQPPPPAPKPRENIEAAATAAVTAAGEPAPYAATSQLPKQMRFCDSRCYTLILRGSHYEAFRDGNSDVNDVDSIYNVVRFSHDAVELYRNDRLEFGLVTGRMDGNTLADGHIEWYRHGGAHEKTACALSWGASLTQAKPVLAAPAEAAAPPPPASTGSALADALLAAAAQADRDHPMGREISIPRGASPFFKKLPDDVRAILQPESVLLPGRHELACNSGEQVQSDEAVEIARYALRAGDFVRGRCWLQRGAADSNVRANELLGVAYIFGLGIPRDEHSGYVVLENVWEKTRDLWSYQLVSKCLENGIGTPVNKFAAERLQMALAMDPQGQALVMSIGADDAEARRRYARINLMMYPPTTHVRDCSHPTSSQLGCEDRVVVDHDAYDRQLQQINAQH